MIILENERYICRYRYEDSEEEFQIESSSIKWLKERMYECTDCGKKVLYKIYAVIEENEVEPVRHSLILRNKWRI